MRVKYLVNNDPCCIYNGIIHIKEDVINLPDDLAEQYIERNIVEAFNYPISDNEIRNFYNEFSSTNDFFKRVDIIVKAFSKSNEFNGFLLNDDTVLKFEVTPEVRKEWHYFNLEMSKLYKFLFPKCSFEGLKNEFKRKQENFKYLDSLRQKEIHIIDEVLSTNYPKGIAYWYEMAIAGEIPLKGEEYREFISRELLYGLDVYLQGIAIAEYKEYLQTLKLKSNQTKVDHLETKFRIEGIDVSKLVEELIVKKYFDKNFKNDVINWFNGSKPESPIPIDINANCLISIIADLCDARPKYIKNTKKFCYPYIANSFLFNGEKAEESYIKKVMNPQNENRRYAKFDKTLPDIQLFTTST